VGPIRPRRTISFRRPVRTSFKTKEATVTRPQPCLAQRPRDGRRLAIWSGAATALMGLASGCGVAALKSQVHGLTKQVQLLNAQSRRNASKLETLSNQIFIIEDRVDSNRVAIHRNAEAPKASIPRHGKTPTPSPVSAHQKTAASNATTQRHAAGLSARQQKHANQDNPAGPPRNLRVVRIKPSSKGNVRKRPGRRVLRLYGTSGQFRSLSGPPLRRRTTDRIPVVPIPAANGPIPAPGPIQTYRRAYRLYLAGRYDQAATIFAGFARQHPRHDYADNALFWLGQCQYKRKRFKSAVASFRRVLRTYPSGNKAPDALLKLGLTMSRLGNKTSAKRVLAQVVEIYPNTRVARLAARALQSLR